MERGKDGSSDDVAQCWDREYESGRYEAEPPVQFVRAIIGELRKRGWTGRRGIYVGCGNGRNYAPLAATCDGLRGIDVSESGIRRLLQGYPEHAGRVSRGNFLDDSHDMERAADYLMSIQAFQHGDERTAERYFERAAAVLRHGGLLFLRVNSASTDVYHSHEVVERNDCGGFTIVYSAGPKKGLRVHFFARRELESELHRTGFDLLNAPVERAERRRPPKTGEWRQWELTAVRRAR